MSGGRQPGGADAEPEAAPVVIEPLLTARQLADDLGFAAGTIVDWAEAGSLPCFKVGGRLRFRESEVLAWLERQRLRSATSQVHAPRRAPGAVV